MTPTRTVYDSQLTHLKHELLRMGEEVKNAIIATTKALEERDLKAAEEIIKHDDEIDAIQYNIEETCINLIMTQQPVARDLRNIFAINKIASDLERIGDYAHSIAKINIAIQGSIMKKLTNIHQMCNIATQMLTDVLDAYMENDDKAAREVSKRDDMLDSLYEEIFKELMAYVIADPKLINQAFQLLLITRYYERTGDHITNISEWVVFNKTGKIPDLG